MKDVVNYLNLATDINQILQDGRRTVFFSTNTVLLQTYWKIGQKIVEYEQKGNDKAEYGSELLKKLSKELKQQGKGFSRTNLQYMRLLYLYKSEMPDASCKLTWSHYLEILKLDNRLAQQFYENQCTQEYWSTRELKRQKDSMLFERLAKSKDKTGVIALSTQGHSVMSPGDLVKDPYILEFLNIPEYHHYSEKELEQTIIDNLQHFILELGKGFTFVKRQFRISFDSRHHYVDLVFYHRILKCFVLIDLKVGEADHRDIGQMNMYLNYFKTEENVDEDNEPIGIILSAEKHEIKMEYALGGLSNQLFVSKYQLYLPDKKEMELEIEKFLEEDKRLSQE
jgi:predicted nuclease of restriction endonuclease-like (RecB) superfamily